MKFGTLWAKCWGLATADFGRDPCSSDSLRGSRNFVFFLSVTDFPWTIFTNFAQNNVNWCRDVNFQNSILKNFIIRVFFQNKTQKRHENFQLLATSGRQNSAMITDRRKLTETLRCVKFPFLLLESIQSHSPGMYAPHRTITPKVSLWMTICRSRCSIRATSIYHRPFATSAERRCPGHTWSVTAQPCPSGAEVAALAASRSSYSVQGRTLDVYGTWQSLSRVSKWIRSTSQQQPSTSTSSFCQQPRLHCSTDKN